MPVKLLGTVVLLIIVTIFCGFNLGEDFRCNINLLFHTFEHVPVFLTVLISFFAGVLIMIPFTWGNAKHRAEQKAADEKARQAKIAAREQAKADQEAKRQAERAEKERKEAERLAKKNAKKAGAAKPAEKSAVHSANEVPVIKAEKTEQPPTA